MFIYPSTFIGKYTQECCSCQVLGNDYTDWFFIGRMGLWVPYLTGFNIIFIPDK